MFRRLYFGGSQDLALSDPKMIGFKNIEDLCLLLIRKRVLNSRSRVGGRELAGSATLSRIQAPSHREASRKIIIFRTVAERG